MKNYGEGAGTDGKAECWTVVITMVRVIWKERRKVRVEAETAYGSENQTEKVGTIPLGDPTGTSSNG